MPERERKGFRAKGIFRIFSGIPFWLRPSSYPSDSIRKEFDGPGHPVSILPGEPGNLLEGGDAQFVERPL